MLNDILRANLTFAAEYRLLRDLLEQGVIDATIYDEWFQDSLIALLESLDKVNKDCTCGS